MQVDRLHEWMPTAWGAIQDTLKRQKRNTLQEFDTRVEAAKVALAEKGFNSALYYENEVRARSSCASCVILPTTHAFARYTVSGRQFSHIHHTRAHVHEARSPFALIIGSPAFLGHS